MLKMWHVNLLFKIPTQTDESGPSFLSFPTSQFLKALVDGYPIYPGRQFGLIPELPNMANDMHKNFLADVLGICWILQNRQADIVNL